MLQGPKIDGFADGKVSIDIRGAAAAPMDGLTLQLRQYFQPMI